MGTFQIELDSEKLKETIKKADKVCGTLEPSNRKITFFAEEGRLYLLASDGCLGGYFEISQYLFSKNFSPFEIPLDVVKQFVSELNGKVNLIYQNGIVTFKCLNETLRLRVNYSSEEVKLPKVPQHYINISRKQLLNEIDFVSCYLEEGQNINVFINGKVIELISHNFGIVAYSVLKAYNIQRYVSQEDDKKVDVRANENIEDKLNKVALSIPYVSARHTIKVLDLEDNEELKIRYSANEKKVYIEGRNLYKVCGDKPEEGPDRIGSLCKMFKQKFRINNNQLKRLLRRALIAGKFSDMQLYTRSGELVVVSHHGSIAYKGSMEIGETESNNQFSIKTKAYLIRGALNRIGSQNVLVDVIENWAILAAPSLTRFIILKNNTVQ
ncbi:MAG: hypothetical protein ACK4R7_03470 [Fervidobacterium sp.]